MGLNKVHKHVKPKPKRICYYPKTFCRVKHVTVNTKWGNPNVLSFFICAFLPRIVAKNNYGSPVTGSFPCEETSNRKLILLATNALNLVTMHHATGGLAHRKIIIDWIETLPRPNHCVS